MLQNSFSFCSFLLISSTTSFSIFLLLKIFKYSFNEMITCDFMWLTNCSFSVVFLVSKCGSDNKLWKDTSWVKLARFWYSHFFQVKYKAIGSILTIFGSSVYVIVRLFGITLMIIINIKFCKINCNYNQNCCVQELCCNTIFPLVLIILIWSIWTIMLLIFMFLGFNMCKFHSSSSCPPWP